MVASEQCFLKLTHNFLNYEHVATTVAKKFKESAKLIMVPGLESAGKLLKRQEQKTTDSYNPLVLENNCSFYASTFH